MAQDPAQAVEEEHEILSTYNQVGHLTDPLLQYYKLFKSMIDGLNTCSWSFSLQENPVICVDLIQDF
ncbi:MAG: hypothetical protein Q8755_02680 [Candidatus Phytoplasma australasiaticum]|nr:hypothetical protein [Candidatus Phytoplasma australasiaticum]